MKDSVQTAESITEAETTGIDINSEPKEIKSLSFQPSAPSSIKKFLAMIHSLVKDGTISPHQSIELRRQAGISKAYFTKKRINKAKKKKRKMIAQASRRRNRNLGKG